jgi:hypothetical protein
MLEEVVYISNSIPILVSDLKYEQAGLMTRELTNLPKPSD